MSRSNRRPYSTKFSAWLIVAGFGLRVVEDHDHVRLDGDTGVVTTRKGVLQDVANAARPSPGQL